MSSSTRINPIKFKDDKTFSDAFGLLIKNIVDKVRFKLLKYKIKYLKLLLIIFP